MSTKTDAQRVIKREFKRACPVDLTDDEIKKIAQKAGRLKKAMDAEETALKEKHKEEKAEFRKKHAKLSTMLADLERLQEDRDVKCVEIYDYREGVVEEVRTDTEEVINKRKMEPGERQGEIGDTTAAGKKKGKKDKGEADEGAEEPN